MSSSPLAKPAARRGWRLLALLLSVVLSTLASLFVKYALVSFSPFAVAALRVWLASVVMLPLALLLVPGGLHWRGFRSALPMSLCYSINSVLFAVGIANTTAIAAQLLYMLVPVVVLLGSRIVFAEALTPPKLIGTALGIAGAVVVLFGSAQGQVSQSLGTPLGNVLIVCSVFAWSAFTLLARRQSQSQPPLALTCYALLTSSLLMPVLVLPDLLRHQARHGNLTWLAIVSILLLAVLVSVTRDFLLQWGIQGTSAFTSSAMGFVAPFLAVAYAIPLLGEQLSASLLISGGLIILGLFFAVIVPLRQQRAESRKSAPLPGDAAGPGAPLGGI